MDERRNAEVWPSNLLSSLHVATDLSVFESIMLGHQRLHINPTHPLFDLPIQTAITTCDDATKTDSYGSAEALLPLPDLLIQIITCINKLTHFPLHPTSELHWKDKRLFLWLDCLLSLYSMWTLPRVYVCVGDFSILFRLIPPLCDVSCNWFECVCVCVSFSTFQCAASILLFESFYELCLFLIANFTSWIRRGTIFMGTLVCVDGQSCAGYVLYVFLFWYLMSLRCCQVPMGYCTGTNWWKHWARPRNHIWM